jgi:hypothetical protein
MNKEEKIASSLPVDLRSVKESKVPNVFGCRVSNLECFAQIHRGVCEFHRRNALNRRDAALTREVSRIAAHNIIRAAFSISQIF